MKGLVIELTDDEAVVVLENNTTYTIPKCFLPKNIILNDFIIVDNGKVSIDENGADYLEYMENLLKGEMN